MAEDIRESLLTGRKTVAVWGAGFIGATTAMAFASEGVRVKCHDINPKTTDEINKGNLGVANLEFWFGATMKEFVDRGLVSAVGDWKSLRGGDIAAHFVAVPTEREGEPWLGAVEDVLAKIRKCKCRVAVIESTLVPGSIEKLNPEGISIAVAPRRDWFHSPEKNLKNLPRVFAARDPKQNGLFREILSIVCDHLLAASSISSAELVKSVENSLLHLPAVYAIQLAHAYPDADIREVLELASTHWRIPLYYPSFGTGGYCVPLSSKYVLYGAEKPERLTIAGAAVETDGVEPLFVAGKAAGHAAGRPVAVMGISYKGDLKVCQLSPAIPIARRLIENGNSVSIHDPYYSHKEAREIVHPGVKWFEPEKGLGGFAAVLVVTDHKKYQRIPVGMITGGVDPGTLILDNYGIWRKYESFFRAAKEKKIIYQHTGCKGWGRE